MTKEEKQLLIKDICARLPYGVKCTTNLTSWNGIYTVEGVKVQGVFMESVIIDCPVYDEGDDEWMLESIILFLRPLSSMTEEEKEYIKNRWCYEGWSDAYDLFNYHVIDINDVEAFTDWLNAHHFDYRGLINKNLALEAPEGMYLKEE